MYDDPFMAHYDMKILMDFSTQLSHFQTIFAYLNEISFY